MKLAKILLQVLLISILTYSCTLFEKFEMQSDKYKVTYSINTTKESSMTKIKYTDIEGNTVILTDFNLPWTYETIVSSGQTVILEVYGDLQETDIYMEIHAENEDNKMKRDLIKESNNNKHYHYYVTHTLE